MHPVGSQGNNFLFGLGKDFCINFNYNSDLLSFAFIELSFLFYLYFSPRTPEEIKEYKENKKRENKGKPDHKEELTDKKSCSKGVCFGLIRCEN